MGEAVVSLYDFAAMRLRAAAGSGQADRGARVLFGTRTGRCAVHGLPPLLPSLLLPLLLPLLLSLLLPLIPLK